MRSFSHDARAGKARGTSTRNGSKGTSGVRRWRRAVASGVPVFPPLPPFLLAAHNAVSLCLIVFIPVPYRSVSPLSISLLPSLLTLFSISRFFHPLCGRVPLFLPLSSLSSLRFRPLPLSRRYFRDDELQYAPIVAAGNQRAYPKSSMVSTHPTQPKPSLAQPGTRPIRTQTPATSNEGTAV